MILFTAHWMNEMRPYSTHDFNPVPDFIIAGFLFWFFIGRLPGHIRLLPLFMPWPVLQIGLMATLPGL